MPSPNADRIATFAEVQDLKVRVGTVLKPRSPITTKDLFAGRWNEITRLAEAVWQTGLHVIIYGERGVGKTSLANVIGPVIHAFDHGKDSAIPDRLVLRANAATGDTFSSIWYAIFREITWDSGRPTVGLLPGRKRASVIEAFELEGDLRVDDVRRVLANMVGSLFVIDEFDRVAQETSQEFTDLIKSLSDFSVDCTVILVGVADSIDALVSGHASIKRAIDQIELPRMKAEELKDILVNAEKSLGVHFAFDAYNLIVHLSQGLPHYTHLMGSHAVRHAADRYSRLITRDDVFAALEAAVGGAEQSVRAVHSKAVHSSHSDALYRQVLFACGVAAATSEDSLGYFNPAGVISPLGIVLKREVQFATFNSHISEFCQAKRMQVLERDGEPRSYRYRFRDPLLVPFVFMDALSRGLVQSQELSKMLGAKEPDLTPDSSSSEPTLLF